MAKQAIFYDSSYCTACKACQVACKNWNLLPSPMELNSQEWGGTMQCPADLEENTRLIITFDEKPREKYGVDWAFGRRACQHCAEAGCVMACPADCLKKDEETGFTIYEPDKCIGCQYCHAACPFDVPRHTGIGFTGKDAKINKCTACIDRIREGRAPACVTTCQPGALKFGDRDEMIALAHERVEWLKERGYEHARVYGEEELGGLNVIHVLKYPIEQYTLPENPQVSPLVGAMQWLKPLLGVGAAALLGGLGISFLTGVGYKREDLIYDEVNHNIINKETGEIVRHIDKEAGER